jgi:hypothetical protein
MDDWKAWVGLPHEVGADPREGRAACCVQITKLVLESQGLTFPVAPERIYALAEQKNAEQIAEIFAAHTQQIEKAEPYCVTLFLDESIGYGVGIVVPDHDNGRLFLLIPHHRKGVLPVPVDVLASLKLYRVLL